MKGCKIEGCDREHHALGLCTIHYNEHLFKTKLINIKCSVEGCENHISPNTSKEKLCEMHFTRLKRNGDVNIKKRNRNYKTIITELLESDDPGGVVITADSSYVSICRLLFGNVCSICGWSEGLCHIHHKLHKKDGGENTISNALVLCPNCHSLIHNRTCSRVLSKQMQNAVNIIRKKCVAN